MQAAFLNALIKADTTILRTFIWHSSHLRFVFWSGQEAASVIPVTEWPYLWAAIHDAEKVSCSVTCLLVTRRRSATAYLEKQT